jgi:hypothetical protein
VTTPRPVKFKRSGDRVTITLIQASVLAPDLAEPCAAEPGLARSATSAEGEAGGTPTRSGGS